MVAIVAPICEEVICRGIIPTKLFEGYEKIWIYFRLVSLHYSPYTNNLPSFLIYGWMSAVLTWTAYRTKRLEMSIFLHLVINGVSILLLHPPYIPYQGCWYRCHSINEGSTTNII